MTNTVTYTTTEISLAKLVPSPANARRTGAGLGIEALAASIQAHGLLQSLVVRPALDGQGQPTGKYEVAAGGRRLAALKLLAKRRRIGKGAAIPCRVLDADGVDGAEASLAENVVRVDMHPADQFEAFARLHQELPYHSTVETEIWKELRDGSVRIEQTIYVERESQRKIVLGKAGATIKAIGAAARPDIAAAIGQPVHLFLFVKVREGWSDDPERYREMGLEFPRG